MDTPAGQMHVIYRWKSIYVFSPTLVKTLLQHLEEDPVRCEFDAIGQAFVLDGLRDDVVEALEKLRRAVQAEFNESMKNRRSHTYIPLIQRSRLSEFNSDPIIWKEDVDDEAESSIKPLKDGEFSLVKSWSPKMGTDFASLLHPQDAEADIPTMIERVCDCQIEKDTFNRKLNIRANDPYVIGRVVDKLDRIETIFNTRLVPKTTHLVHVEDKKEFELRLVPLKAQLRTIGNTTLFAENHGKKYYRSRKEIFSLRLLRRDDPASKPEVVSLTIKEIPGDREANGPRAWRNYQFVGYGGSDNNPAVYVRPRANASVPRSNAELDSHHHANVLSRALNNVLVTHESVNSGPMPRSFAQQFDESIDFLDGPRPNFDQTESESAKLPNAAKRRVRDSDDPSTNQLPLIQPIHPLGFERGQPDILKATESDGTLPAAFVASSYYEDDLGHLLRSAPPARDFLSANPGSSSIPPLGIVRATRRVKSPEDVILAEQEQKVAEQDTRIFRNVNSQRSPWRDTSSSYVFREHEKYNMKTMREVLEPAFDYARLHKCKINFEARIGRVIFDSAPPPAKCMKWNDLDPILDDRRDTMKVLFTERVTTDYVDVDYICDLKLSAEQHFFNHDPDEKSISYEFVCDYKGKPCIIKFDAETWEMEVLGRKETYGTVFWNCPLRSWDSRFTLQARKILNVEEPAFRSLADSLFIPDDTRLPNITFRTEANNLMVKKVYCKRESRYLVLPTLLTGPRRNFEFRMTEVQDLWMHAHTGSDETFKASATERVHMIASERLHYTFSLVPSKHDEIFRAQTNLEVGEVPDWTGSSMLENNLLEAMTGIINALIERMDDVGFNNKGSWRDGF